MRSRFIALVWFCLFAAGAVFAQSSAPNPASEDPEMVRLLNVGIQLARSGRQHEAIEKYFDVIIANYEGKYRDNDSLAFSARSMVESLAYLLEAANAPASKQKSAKVYASTWADAYFAKGWAYVELRQPDEAQKALEKARALAPHNAHILNELGNLQLAQKNWSAAFQIFQQSEKKATEFSPPELKNAELSRAWRGMGYVLIEQGKHDEALEMYRRCLNLDPQDTRALSQIRYIETVRARATHNANQPSAAAPAPVSQALLDHLYQQLEQFDRSASTDGTATASANAAVQRAEYSSRTRPQLQQLGVRAQTLAPKLAELLLKTQKNQYEFGWLLSGMYPFRKVDAATSQAAVLRLASLTPVDKLQAISEMGKFGSTDVLEELGRMSADPSPTTRLAAVIALTHAGAAQPELAAGYLGAALKDAESYNRTAAANSLRALGSRAATAAAPALIAYFQTRDNVYMAARALNQLSTAFLAPLKPDFESLLSNPTTNQGTKQEISNLLVRIETKP